MSETITTPDGISALLMADGRHRQEGIQSAVVEAAALGAEIVAQATPRRWRGHLKQSIIAQPLPKGAEVRVDAPYAGIIEVGARPHMPPLGPLLEWAREHTRGFGIKNPRFRGSGPKKNESAADFAKRSNKAFAKHLEKVDDFERAALDLANAIRFKIAHYGSPPTWWVKGCLAQMERVLARCVKKAMERK